MLAEQRRRRPAYGAAKMVAGWEMLYAGLMFSVPATDRAPVTKLGLR
jgi:hypothetical protein